MPRIIVTADGSARGGEQEPIMFTERVSVSDFESKHFQAQLVERLGWAVGDADAVEEDDRSTEVGHDAPADQHEYDRSNEDNPVGLPELARTPA